MSDIAGMNLRALLFLVLQELVVGLASTHAILLVSIPVIYPVAILASAPAETPVMFGVAGFALLQLLVQKFVNLR
jgi:hypothetical protein